MKTKNNLTTSTAAFAGLLLAAGSAQATVTFFNSYSGTAAEVNSSTELAYQADSSNTDLINNQAPSANSPLTTGTSNTWRTSNGANLSELNDGIHGRSFATAGSTVEGAWPHPVASVTYTIGLGANSLGFNITSLQSIAAWNGVGFGNQAWTMAVQLAGGGSFVDVATVNYQPLAVAAAGATKVNLSNLNITGIQAIRFNTISVNGGTNAGAFVWRELDVTGISTVPEPSSVLLLGLGGLALLRRRR